MPGDRASYILTILTFLPTIGALGILAASVLLKERAAAMAKWIALAAMVGNLALGAVIWSAFDPAIASDPTYGTAQFIHHFVWIRDFNIEYFVGIDGISVSMVLLSTIVGLIACIASFGIDKRPVGYFSLFLLLQTGMIGTFVALDTFLFYIFWEVMLLPMYFLIGIWGGPRREYAAIKFFLYTLAGSVLMLLAIIALYFNTLPSTDIPFNLVDGTEVQHTFNLLTWAKLGQSGHFMGIDPIFGMGFTKIVFIGLFIGFAIKVPMFPFHTWLPDAHVQAPTPISVILAGVLLKMGTYGMLRFNWSILPDATKYFAKTIAVFGVINIVYAALVCLAQKDLKKLIAYSSVSHMGFVLLGMAACTPQAITGAVYQMWSHGIVSPFLFLLVGVIYDRAHTRDINGFGGLASFMPEFAALTCLGFFASLGLPALAGFIGEVLVFIGAWGTPAEMGEGFRTLVAISVTSVIITAAYYLWAYQRMFFGKFNERWKDLQSSLIPRERVVLYPLAVMTILFGILPKPVFDLINPALHELAAMVVAMPMVTPGA